MGKGVSLSTATTGGFLDDVDVTIKNCHTGEYTYQGSSTTAQGLLVEFDNAGEDHTEFYSSGMTQPTDDGTGFQSSLRTNSKAWRFIESLIKLGVKVDTDVSVFNGLKLHVKREALPKMAGIDKEGDREKTVLLATKLLGASSKPAARPTPKPVAATAKPAAIPAPASTPAHTNGNSEELTMEAIVAIQEVAATASEQTIARLKLGTAIMLKLAKEKNPNMAAIKKLATDANFLAANAELGSWIFDNDTIQLRQDTIQPGQ